MFGSEHYNMVPDMITIAKGVTSAYAPLSGSIISDKVWKILEQGTDENGPIGSWMDIFSTSNRCCSRSG